MNDRERRYAKAMAQQLLRLPWFEWVRAPNQLSTSDLAKEDGVLAGALGHTPVLQPDIDICLKSREGDLDGVELKVFAGDGRPGSFYRGIGQALALQRYGLDHVALWVVFEELDNLRRLASVAWYFVRNEASLELDFTPYLVEERAGQEVIFHVWQYDGPHRSCDTGHILGDHRPCFRHPNPLLRLESDVGQRIWDTRHHIEEWLVRRGLKLDDYAPAGPVGPPNPAVEDWANAGPTGPAGLPLGSDESREAIQLPAPNDCDGL